MLFRRKPRLLQANSRQVSSNQRHLHHGLAKLVEKHLGSDFRKPVATHNLRAFKALMTRLESAPRPIVLDSFCGTGHSTAILAQRHEGHLIVGIDKSAQRLGKHVAGPADN
jgi:tRNA (guanine-N7-)-methyltransferase